MKNKAGEWVEPRLEATSAAGEGANPPATCGFATIDADGEGLPDHGGHVPDRLAGRLQGRPRKDKAASLKAWLTYVLGDGQDVAPAAASTRRCRRSIQTKAQAKVDALTATAADRGASEATDGGRDDHPAGERGSALHRSPAARLPDGRSAGA